MVHNCIVTGCRYRKRKNIVKGIVFHSFPIDQARLAKWEAAIAAHCPNPINITRHSKICQFHFLESDYVQTTSSKSGGQHPDEHHRIGGHRRNTRHLKSTAVPSIFEPWTEPDVSKKQHELAIGCGESVVNPPPCQCKSSPTECLPSPPDDMAVIAACSRNDSHQQGISYSVNQILSGGNGSRPNNNNKYDEPLNSMFMRDCCVAQYSNRVPPGRSDMLSHAFMIDGCGTIPTPPSSSTSLHHSDRYVRQNEMMNMFSIGYPSCGGQGSRKRKNLVDTINALHKKNGAVPGKLGGSGGVSGESVICNENENAEYSAAGVCYNASTAKQNGLAAPLNLVEVMKQIRQDELHATMLTETIANMQSLGSAQSELRAQHEFQLYHLLSKANLIHYYSAFLAAGGDDVIQLCQLSREDFNQLVELVGMANKPFHVKRLKKVLYRLRIKLRLTRSSGSDSSDNEEPSNLVRQLEYSRASSSASTPATGYSQINNACSTLKITATSQRRRSFLADQAFKVNLERLAKCYSQLINEDIDPTGITPDYESLLGDGCIDSQEKEALLRQLANIYPCSGFNEDVLSDHQLCVNEAATQLCKLKPCLLTRRRELSSLSMQIASELMMNVYNMPTVPGTSGSVPVSFCETKVTNRSSDPSSRQASPNSSLEQKPDGSASIRESNSESFPSEDSTEAMIQTTGAARGYCSSYGSEASGSDEYMYNEQSDTNMEPAAAACLARDQPRDKTLASLM